LYKLDQFILSGGRVGVFLSSKIIDMTNQFMPVSENSTNLPAFLEHYGFRFGRDLLIDRQSYQVQAMQNLGFIQIPVAVEYPLAPRITDMNSDNPIVNRLGELGFFYVTEIAPTDSSVAFTSLLKTSEQTGIAQADPRTRMVNISATAEYQDFMFSSGSKTVAAAIETQAGSYFGDARPDTIDYPDPHLSTAQSPATFVAAGSGTFTQASYMIPATLTFFLNSVDWLFDENGLISIRSKNIQPRQLDELQSGTRQFLKWMNILLAPFIIVAIGMIRWSLRKRVKRLASGG
jgi:ABC-type uncharacterized transport system involved in gliding motility auxiliary subunit